MTLRGKTVVITGAARGIGFAVAERLVKCGANVVLADVDEAALKEAAAGLPTGQVLAVHCNVTAAGDVPRLSASAAARFGPISVWINNAGLARHRPIQDYTEAEIDLMLAVNLKGLILGSQAALKAMIPQRGGHIINILSTASLRGIPGETVYCAAKWGARGFTHGLAEEAAPHRIRVTAILPGGVDTEFWDAARPGQAPRQLFLKPAQVADAIIACLEMDDRCVPRELVLRSLDDRDFSAPAT